MDLNDTVVKAKYLDIFFCDQSRKNSRVFLLDGGLGSSLQEDGIQLKGNPLWSASILHSQPDCIYKVHSDFLKSGSQILITSSYQASIQGYEKYLGLTKEASLDLIRKSVQIAQKARANFQPGEDNECRPIFIAGSVGPYGACQADLSEYTGSYISKLSEVELIEWHKPRIEALMSAGVDFLAIETIPAVKEAIAILKLLKNYPTAKAWVSFSCKDSQHTSAGDKFGDAVLACLNENKNQLIGIGINCTSPGLISPLLQEASKTIPLSFPKIVYPTSGDQPTPVFEWEKTSSNIVNQVKEDLSLWMQLGVRVVGGCCMVTPAIIKEISTIVQSHVTNEKN